MHKFLSKKARANGKWIVSILDMLLISAGSLMQLFDGICFARTVPSSAEVKTMCAQVAQFYLDHAFAFPSKAAIVRFSKQCGCHYDRTKRRLKDAFASRKALNKSARKAERPRSSLTSRSESKLSESYRRKSLTPRADMLSSSSRASRRGSRGRSQSDVPRIANSDSFSRFVPVIDFKNLHGNHDLVVNTTASGICLGFLLQLQAEVSIGGCMRSIYLCFFSACRSSRICRRRRRGPIC